MSAFLNKKHSSMPGNPRPGKSSVTNLKCQAGTDSIPAALSDSAESGFLSQVVTQVRGGGVLGICPSGRPLRQVGGAMFRTGVDVLFFSNCA